MIAASLVLTALLSLACAAPAPSKRTMVVHDALTASPRGFTRVKAASPDAVLNFREAYMEYIPNYPIAAYRIDDEMANNPQFKAFVDVSTVATVYDMWHGSADPARC